MGPTSLYTLPLLLTLASAPTPVPTAVPGPPVPGGYLSEEDAVYLDYLLHEFLFDPKNAVRVEVAVPSCSSLAIVLNRISLGELDLELREGWLVKGSHGKPDRIYFTDGEAITGPFQRLRQIDFESECESRFRCGIVDRSKYGQLARLRSYSSDAPDNASLARAAWLHRRGYDGLAAQALEEVRARERDETPTEDLRLRLARHAYESMCRAVGARADAEAISHGERICRLYSDLIDEHCPQVVAILADLHRRRQAGTFAKAPPKDWPKGFADWDTTRRVRYLIDSLDEISPEPSVGRFGREWSIDSDRRFTALFEMGDAAVPALLDAAEGDTRLTRCKEWQVQTLCFSGIHEKRPTALIGVNAVAMRIAAQILRVNNLEPLAAAEEEDNSRPGLVRRMRRYWADFGHLAFDARMMAILTNPTARSDARCDAARALVSAYEVYSSSWPRRTRSPRHLTDPPNPLIAKFKSPTVAEAILAALDAERRQSSRGRESQNVEEKFVDSLVELGDYRIGAELARRAPRSDNIERRIQYAEAAEKLGCTGPMLSLCRDVRTGAIPLTQELDQPSRVHDVAARSLRQLIYSLMHSDLGDADEAIWSLADPDHPWFSLLSELIIEDPDYRYHFSDWSSHPAFVRVLAHSLSDMRLTGVHYYLRGKRVEISGEPNRERERLRADSEIADDWVEHAEERVADVVAIRLSSLVCGLPKVHPLRRDQDQALIQSKSILDRYRLGLRMMNDDELSRIAMRRVYSAFIPDIKTLGRPATASDVRLGRAVFDLNGRGKIADRKLPAWLILKSEAKNERPAYGLVVQAETDANGKLVYGVIFRHEIRAVKADEVERIEPYEKK